MYKNTLSITEVNQNFSKAVKEASLYGDVIIYKRNKPKMLIIDLDQMGEGFYEAFEQLKIQFLSENIMNEYDEAYKKLAK